MSTLTFVNVQGSSTMYPIMAPQSNPNLSRNNSSYAELSRLNLITPITTKYGPITNNGSLIPTIRNSFNIGVITIFYVYIWINKGDPTPSANRNVVSDVVTS